mgnify:CR=1 FL=1|tara:strand:- start:4542 stop:5306 length:765 start_codon:yes stop_codon:yes gene_type:complete
MSKRRCNTDNADVFIGAWHKTGINAIKSLFRLYKEDVPTFEFQFKKKLGIGFNHYVLEHSKVILCIRNPYETIVSGMRYHQKTKEKWCIQPHERYGGISYKEHISNLETEEEKLLFEMRENAYLTITSMYDFVRDHSQYEIYSKTSKNIKEKTPDGTWREKGYNINDNIVFIRLEQFETEEGRQEIVDTITSHVPNMDKDILAECIQAHGRKKFNKTHDGSGYTYDQHFTGKLYHEFDELFPEDLFEVLGYQRK